MTSLQEEHIEKIIRNPRVLHDLSRDAKLFILKQICDLSDEFFARHIVPHWTTDQSSGLRIPSADIHRDMWGMWNEGGDLLFVIPRDHAKTTSISKIKILKALLFKEEKSILLICSGGLGEKIIGDIRKELEENEMIRALFGRLVPIENKIDLMTKNKKWRQKELQLLNGTEIKTVTKGGSLRGYRPTLILMDDPQEDKEVRNPVQAEQFNTWVWSTVYPTLDDGGRMIVLGTVISENCFVNTLRMEAESRNFKLIFARAVELDSQLEPNEDNIWEWLEKGKLLWPEKWSREALVARCKKIDVKPFLQEYMNQPQQLYGSRVYDKSIQYTILSPKNVKDDIHYFVDSLEGRNAFLGIDIASGSLTGDYSTIIVRDEKFKLLAEYRGHIPQDALTKKVDQIISELSKATAAGEPAHLKALIVPEVNIGTAFINAAREYKWFNKLYRKEVFDQVTKKRTKQIGWTTTEKSKIDMITYQHSIYREGDIEISERLKQEIDKYYYDENGGMNAIAPYHDDLVIADALCMQGVKKGVSTGASITVID